MTAEASRSRVAVYAPGSVSNLGPGFDCLGLAFTGRGDLVTAHRTETPGVRVTAVSDPRVPTEAGRNTAAIAASAVLERAGRDGGLELTIEKGLPLAAGMGGSAASAVAGAVAADAALGSRLRRLDLVAAALRAEAAVSGRHPDNVVPSLLGGAVLVSTVDPLQVTAVRVHPDLGLVLVTPGYTVETARARAVLPEAVPRGEAVGQAACLAALVLGLERGDADLIRGSMVDRIAEPARAALYPGYAAARAAGLVAGAFGVAVSGAGPTVVAIVNAATGPAVAAAMQAAYQRLGIPAAIHAAEVDGLGARVVS
jgi:homoserine kinase